MESIRLWPVAASSNAREVDLLFIGLLVVTGLTAALVTMLLIGFAVRYRRNSDADRSDRVKKTWRWETSWTAATFLAFVVLFFWGADLYLRLFRPPPDSLDVFVVAKQWMWHVQHLGGQREINQLHIPVGRPVRLVLTSQDVIHSFFVPAFRIKHDVLPGRYQSLWFEATKPGAYRLECAEYCGTDHAAMGGTVIALAPAEFESWLAREAPASTLAEEGGRLFRSYGCSGCHGPGGTVRAPPLEGLYGRPVPLTGGRVVRADERYIRDSILMPRAEIAAGYAPIMPSFAGKIGEEDLVKLIAYIRSLAETRSP
jgi:cytochrome c oxidase subunit II